MTDRMKDATLRMDTLIHRMNKLNEGGVSKTIAEACKKMEYRKQVCKEMEEVNEIIMDEMRR